MFNPKYRLHFKVVSYLLGILLIPSVGFYSSEQLKNQKNEELLYLQNQTDATEEQFNVELATPSSSPKPTPTGGTSIKTRATMIRLSPTLTKSFNSNLTTQKPTTYVGLPILTKETMTALRLTSRRC